MDSAVTRRWYIVPVAVALAVMVSFSAAPSSPLSTASAAPASAAQRGFPLGEPAYDSGWREIGPGGNLVLAHNLGGSTDRFYVLLEGRDSGGSGRTIMHNSYGGDIVTPGSSGLAVGIAWHHLTSTSISVYRAPNDDFSDKIRVRIWVARPADYDSGWVTAIPDIDRTFSHGLGGNSDDYLVYLEFRSTPWGINQVYLGGDTYYGPVLAQVLYQGGYWLNLDTSQIKVIVGHDSASTIADLRLRIWRAPAPDYDSGWQAVAPGNWVNLNHDLGGPWNDFVVDLEFKDDSGDLGTHIRRYGGDCLLPDGIAPPSCQGAYWTELDANNITVNRVAQDTNADEVRVRIWASSKPKYRYTFAPSAGSATSLPHNLGGSMDDYVVDLQFVQALGGSLGTYGVNQIYYGGDYWCAGDPPTPVLHGVYWDHLNSTGITINRYPHDNLAFQVQARIWVAPPAEYDSDWFDITAGIPKVVTHGLGGAPDDYVVYLEFRDTAVGGKGVHQQGYGGDWYYPTCGGVANRYGGYWLQLTATAVTVMREANADGADQMRIRIWRNTAADYDGAWTNVNPGDSETFTHNVNWNPAGLVTYLTFKDTALAGKGVHHQAFGGDNYPDAGVPGGLRFTGAFWSALTSSSVRVTRLAHDVDADQARVRVWRAGPAEVMLPEILKP